MERIHRAAVSGLGLLAALTFAATGCAGGTGSDGDGSGSAAGPAVGPAAELSRAAAELGKTSFKLSVRVGSNGTLTGAMDSPNQLGHTLKTVQGNGQVLKVEKLLHGADVYVRMTAKGLTLPGVDQHKWMLIDSGKVPQSDAVGLTTGRFDPAAASKLMNAVATAERVNAHDFTGTLDVTKAIGAGGLNDKDVAALGDKAKAVPFKASTDAQGRLVAMTVAMPSIGKRPAEPMTATFSEFGAKVDVMKPPANAVVEAPKALYDKLPR